MTRNRSLLTTKLSPVAAAVALGLGLVACSSSAPAHRPADSGPTNGPSASASAAQSPATARPTSGDFCTGARKIGLEQKVNLTDGSGGVDRSLLPKLDALAAKAPTPISADFALFVTIEHAVLGRGPTDATVLAQLDSPATASRLAHVGTYLHDHCGTG